MTPKRLILLGLATFLLVLVAVLPASWVGGALPAGVQCGKWSGSVWNGQCTGLTVGDGQRALVRLTSLRWKLRPVALLRLRLSAKFDGVWPEGQATGNVLLSSGGAVRLRELAGSSRLDSTLVGAMPKGWSGRAEFRQLEFDWSDGTLGRLGGELQVADLVDARGNALGGYRLEMPASDAPPFTGQARDTGGPVEVAAEVRLAADRSWTLEGRMRARNPADAALGRKLDVLGTADASGWRPLSAAGDFN